MKYLLSQLIVFCLFVSVCQGQVSGTVKHTGKSDVADIPVLLMTAKDSAFSANAYTDSAGHFEFKQLPAADYYLLVQYIGFEDYYSPVIRLGESTSVPPVEIVLKAQNNQLEGVSVVAQKPLIEKLMDRTVVNVDAWISNAGSNALEVLKRSPGVQVNEDGTISLQGKAGVTVFIDDKPTYLSGKELTDYLQSLPASALNTVELMGNPPAKYDAAGNAGVINIRMKKSKVQGFKANLNLAATHGERFRSNNSLNLSWNKNKISLYTILVFNKRTSFQDLNLYRTYFDQAGSVSTSFRQHSDMLDNSLGPRMKVGMDYELSKRSTIGASVSGFRLQDKDNTKNYSLLSNGEGELQNIVEARADSRRIFSNIGANLNYQFKIDSMGSNLSFNADYLNYNSALNNSLLNTMKDANGSFLNASNLLGYLPAKLDIITTNGDYERPLGTKAKLSLGYKIGLVITDNIADFRDEANGVELPNEQFSNHFKYRENINAAYINYNTSMGRWGLQAGLRFENTIINGHQLGNSIQPDTTFNRNINSFFPTVYLSYKLDSTDRHLMIFSYGRRINRPNYQDMNPFSYPLDRFTIYGGNPYLRPTFSNNLELSYTFNNRVTATLMYSLVNDVISETIEQNNGMFFSRPGNIGRQQVYGINMNATINPFRFWTLNAYGEYIYNDFSAQLYGQKLNNSGWFGSVNLNNQFTLSKSWTAEISGVYSSRMYYAQFIMIPTGAINFGLSKKLFNNVLNIRLNLNDAFYTNKLGGDILGLEASAARWRNRVDSRSVTLSLSYNFQKGAQVREQKAPGANEERDRVR
ncbi:MAG: TonB-dependent receptor [Sphingobacteriales bacterium]|nr:MAG: TonB-dependent receptor [Sphingobacteriales bacterium]